MKKTHANTHSGGHSATSSVLSLIAITAGTVSVALVIMFAGLFLTMMSLGGNPQSTARLHNARTMDVTLAADSTHTAAPYQKTHSRKGYFRDALLRNEGNSDSATDRQSQPSIRPTRVYAISTTKYFFNHANLIQV